MPTGLVLNELLTNALKHAFQGRDGGPSSCTVLWVTWVAERRLRMAAVACLQSISDHLAMVPGTAFKAKTAVASARPAA